MDFVVGNHLFSGEHKKQLTLGFFSCCIYNTTFMRAISISISAFFDMPNFHQFTLDSSHTIPISSVSFIVKHISQFREVNSFILLNLFLAYGKNLLKKENWEDIKTKKSGSPQDYENFNVLKITQQRCKLRLELHLRILTILKLSYKFNIRSQRIFKFNREKRNFE